ncbi:MAG: DUF4914 family protein [Oscillospiraceae bacterium]|nr:DUF4914 family protein [Oscillospiraceae bacterium]
MKLENIILPGDVKRMLAECEYIYIPENEKALYEKCCEGMEKDEFYISYSVKAGGDIHEATLVRCKNGLAVNYTEDYMRRRDPDSMSIADTLPTDKPRFSARYGYDFHILREETFSWMKKQRLIFLPFRAGGRKYGYDAALICPENAAFFALALGMMQGFLDEDVLEKEYRPEALIYLAPPFRHSHFAGRQAVVHQRSEKLHEVFSYNLYPGPSAKKGVFSILLDIGERKARVCNHASAVISESAYGNRLSFMHEGASGGGKSEMLEPVHTDPHGRILLAKNTFTGEEFTLALKDSCTLTPVADDMVLTRSTTENTAAKLLLADGEEGWFLRVDGDTAYGSIPDYEKISIHPRTPLMFFNIQAVGGATCLIWEHLLESDGKPCTNPRLIIPRTELGCDVDNPFLPVDVRSFGVRMPPSSASSPDYGVMALIQIVPAALAWLWRLISPRGYKNPSISGTSSSKLVSEGVGSYWPFHTGTKVRQANLLLKQIMDTPQTLNILIPNQHIGAFSVGFAPQWIVREFLTRRGGRINSGRLVEARCPIFGYDIDRLKLEGQCLPAGLLHPYMQPELGTEGYDKGAGLLTDFFKAQLGQYNVLELDPLGREIIELCLSDAPLSEYLRLSPELPI